MQQQNPGQQQNLRRRPPPPPVPDDVTGAELDRQVRAELASLGEPAARQVSRHLVMAGRLLDTDPEQAWQHAVAARGRAGRLAVVREAAGLAAYRAGRYAEALAELRTARRLTGSDEHLAVMADCERGLGRPERALTLAASPQARRLEQDQRVELLIVAAGARLDLGQPEAAVVLLQVPDLGGNRTGDAVARLRSAYADALVAAGRGGEAEHWRERARQADVAGTAGIDEESDGVAGESIIDLMDDAPDEGTDPATGPSTDPSTGAG